MYRMLDIVCPILPEGKPRYLMGVGSPDCLIEGVLRGVDMLIACWPRGWRETVPCSPEAAVWWSATRLRAGLCAH
jgi:hypothetical protein